MFDIFWFHTQLIDELTYCCSSITNIATHEAVTPVNYPVAADTNGSGICCFEFEG